MRHPENFASQRPTQPNDVDELIQELRERIAILEASVFGSHVPVGHEQVCTIHEAEIVDSDVHDAHITVQREQGAIAIAIRSPSKHVCTSSRPNVVPSLHQPAMFGNPAPPSMPISPSPGPPSTPIPFVPSQTIVGTPSRPNTVPSSHPPAKSGNPAPPSLPIPPGPPSTPIPFVPSQTIGSSSSWGLMMTPKEVQELLALEPQVGEYYVVIKGRRPGVYLFWYDAHELIDGLKSPCYWKKTDKFAALGQYTMAYQKGNCEYRFQ